MRGPVGVARASVSFCARTCVGLSKEKAIDSQTHCSEGGGVGNLSICSEFMKNTHFSGLRSEMLYHEHLYFELSANPLFRIITSDDCDV